MPSSTKRICSAWVSLHLRLPPLPFVDRADLCFHPRESLGQIFAHVRLLVRRQDAATWRERHAGPCRISVEGV